MKKLALIVIGLVMLSSCENQKDVQSDIDRLKTERVGLQNDISNLENLKSSKSQEIYTLNEQLKELNIYKSGKIPRYILKIKLKQTHFTLDLEQHMKDAMNEVEFELPVDKTFYDSVNKGTKILDEFRQGSLILNGSFGNWEMTVTDKEVR